jgi:hypothetical protein
MDDGGGGEALVVAIDEDEGGWGDVWGCFLKLSEVATEVLNRQGGIGAGASKHAFWEFDAWCNCVVHDVI